MSDIDRNTLSRQAFAVQLGKDAPQTIEYKHTVKRSRATQPQHKRQVVTEQVKTVTTTANVAPVVVSFNEEKMHHRQLQPSGYIYPLAMVGKLSNEQRVYLRDNLPKYGVKVGESSTQVITTTCSFTAVNLSNRAMARIVTNVNKWLMSQGMPYLAILMTKDKGKLSKLQLCAISDYPDSRLYEK